MPHNRMGSRHQLIWDDESKALVVDLDLTIGEFKFRANDDWEVDLGDNEGDGILESGGSNLAIEEAGPYQIKLFLDQPDYSYELSIKSFDVRGIFFSEGQSIDIEDVTLFTDGYAVQKLKM